ncbi:hypothetical protein [Rhizobium sp. SG741]|uniref:hypothetical protein n=1 Tax=Rhizobium sp. SG741 TaxID=2587114 RepID=UPI0012DFEF13|nr:hypothetical protein [Rhizobium sp. SG741]NKJ08790.1 putative membrane protein YvbJ [Rhizobium sp. SG741]
MKHHAEQRMKDDNQDRDRIIEGRARPSHRKYAVRWMIVIFCLIVWIAVAMFFIW